MTEHQPNSLQRRRKPFINSLDDVLPSLNAATLTGPNVTLSDTTTHRRIATIMKSSQYFNQSNIRILLPEKGKESFYCLINPTERGSSLGDKCTVTGVISLTTPQILYLLKSDIGQYTVPHEHTP